MLLKVWNIQKQRRTASGGVRSRNVAGLYAPGTHASEASTTALLGNLFNVILQNQQIWGEGRTSSGWQVFRPKQFHSKKAWKKDTVFPPYLQGIGFRNSRGYQNPHMLKSFTRDPTSVVSVSMDSANHKFDLWIVESAGAEPTDKKHHLYLAKNRKCLLYKR